MIRRVNKGAALCGLACLSIAMAGSARAAGNMEEAIAKFGGDMSNGMEEAKAAALAARTAASDMEGEFAKLKAEVKTQLASASAPVPADTPESPGAPQEKAIPSTATRLEEEKKS